MLAQRTCAARGLAPKKLLETPLVVERKLAPNSGRLRTRSSSTAITWQTFFCLWHAVVQKNGSAQSFSPEYQPFSMYVIKDPYEEVLNTLMLFREPTCILGKQLFVCNRIPNAEQCSLRSPQERLFVLQLGLGQSDLLDNQGKMTLSSIGVLTYRFPTSLKPRWLVLSITKARTKNHLTRNLLSYSCQIVVKTFPCARLVVFVKHIGIFKGWTGRQWSCSLLDDTHALQHRHPVCNCRVSLCNSIQILQRQTEESIPILQYLNVAGQHNPQIASKSRRRLARAFTEKSTGTSAECQWLASPSSRYGMSSS